MVLERDLSTLLHFVLFKSGSPCTTGEKKENFYCHGHRARAHTCHEPPEETIFPEIENTAMSGWSTVGALHPGAAPHPCPSWYCYCLLMLSAFVSRALFVWSRTVGSWFFFLFYSHNVKNTTNTAVTWFNEQYLFRESQKITDFIQIIILPYYVLIMSSNTDTHTKSHPHLQ